MNLKNAKYGFGGFAKLVSPSPYANVAGEENVVIQLQYTKQQIDSFDGIIENLRSQIAGQGLNGAAVNTQQVIFLQNKLAEAINQQNEYKKSYDRLIVQRDIIEQQKMAEAQHGVIKNDIGVASPEASISNGTKQPIATSASAKKPIGTFGWLIGAAAIFGIYKLIK